MKYRDLSLIAGIVGLVSACGTKDTGVDNGSLANVSVGGNGTGATAGNSNGASNGTNTSVAGNGATNGGAGANVGGNSNSSTDGGANSNSTGGTFSVGGDGCTQQQGVSGPAVLEFVIDNTMSMSTVTPSTNGQTKMACTRAAFQAEIPNFQDALAVGLTYYHVNSGPCNDGVQAVEIAPLGTGNSAQRQALITSINTQAQIQMTPSSDAWLFGASHVLGWTAPANFSNATRYVVIMTDGVPTVGDDCADTAGCNQGITATQYQPYIDKVHSAYLSLGLKTFFIGVPGSEDLSQVTCTGSTTPLYDPRTKLSELAIAGGTALAGCSTTGSPWCHIDLTDPNINFQVELQKAIQTVVSSAKSCHYTVDPAMVSNPDVYVDPTRTTVTYTPGGGSPTTVPMSAGCADPNGWQYSNSNNTELDLCPALCDAYTAAPDDVIEVHFDCVRIG